MFPCKGHVNVLLQEIKHNNAILHFFLISKPYFWNCFDGWRSKEQALGVYAHPVSGRIS